MGALRFDFINCSAAGLHRGGWIFAAKRTCGASAEPARCIALPWRLLTRTEGAIAAAARQKKQADALAFDGPKAFCKYRPYRGF